MEIAASIEEPIVTRADVDACFALLSDVRRSVDHFPDVASLVPVGETWRWRLRELGVGPLRMAVSYANRYNVDPDARLVEWVPVPGFGNTQMEGRWILEPLASGTRITMDGHFVMDTPFPRLMRPAVEAVIGREHERLVRTYMRNLVTTLHGGDGRAER